MVLAVRLDSLDWYNKRQSEKFSSRVVMVSGKGNKDNEISEPEGIGVKGGNMNNID